MAVLYSFIISSPSSPLLWWEGVPHPALDGGTPSWAGGGGVTPSQGVPHPEQGEYPILGDTSSWEGTPFQGGTPYWGYPILGGTPIQGVPHPGGLHSRWGTPSQGLPHPWGVPHPWWGVPTHMTSPSMHCSCYLCAVQVAMELSSCELLLI